VKSLSSPQNLDTESGCRRVRRKIPFWRELYFEKAALFDKKCRFFIILEKFCEVKMLFVLGFEYRL